MDDEIKFTAIVKKVEAKSLVSLDKSYRLTLDTMEAQALEVGAWPADETVTVIVRRNSKSGN